MGGLVRAHTKKQIRKVRRRVGWPRKLDPNGTDLLRARPRRSEPKPFVATKVGISVRILDLQLAR